MPRIPKGWIPRGEREQEQYYRDVSEKLGGTTATLSDEEQKSAIPFLGMVQDLTRQLTAMQREMRRVQTEVQALKRRLKNVEGEL